LPYPSALPDTPANLPAGRTNAQSLRAYVRQCPLQEPHPDLIVHAATINAPQGG